MVGHEKRKHDTGTDVLGNGLVERLSAGAAGLETACDFTVCARFPPISFVSITTNRNSDLRTPQSLYF